MIDKILITIGTLSILIGVFGFFVDREKKMLIFNIKQHTSDTINFVQEMWKDIKTERSGNFSMITEIVGTITEKEALISPITQTPCIYYETKVIRLTENPQEKEEVYHKTEHTNFYVRDDSGEILIEAKDLIDSFKPMKKVVKDEFVENIKGISIPKLKEDVTLIGYQVEELVIPAGTRVYIHGEATDRNGELMIANSLKKGEKILISNLSKQEYIKVLKEDIMVGNIMVPMMIIIGGVLIWLGIN